MTHQSIDRERPSRGGRQGGAPSGDRGERVSDARTRPARRGTRPKVDPSAPSIDRPAHPLPTTRRGSLNYDQYLQRATDKFQIFSAGERRARRKRAAVACAVVVLVAIIIIWAALSQVQ